MSDFKSNFIYMLCQPGMEKVLKEEIHGLQPTWSFAFSRPGFVTFKSPDALGPDLRLDSIFTREYGISLGKNLSPREWVDRFPDAKAIFVYERDRFAPETEPKGYRRGQWRDATINALSDVKNVNSKEIISGDLILSLIHVEENEVWAGAHIHSPLHSPWPGGWAELEMPPHAPSRAYLKLVEAIERFQIPIGAGQVALEVGSAPGGAAAALLERGIDVVGVDPGAMDLARLEKTPGEARFHHIAMPVQNARRALAQERFSWLLLDMNVDPEQALDWLEPIIRDHAQELEGLLLTFKLNDLSLSKRIPHICRRLEAWGFGKQFRKQLSHNRQEFFTYARKN